MITGPIAVGGIGGSGTRILAGILRDLGVFIGTDLPRSLDTIWYAALFGRRNVLLDCDGDFADLAGLFFRQMSEPQPLTGDEIGRICALARDERHQHDPQTIETWIESFIAHGENGHRQRHWGWKLPYTYILIDRLLALRPDLKYIHMTRDGRDMAFSGNQNQLGKWGPVLLNRNVELGPRDALAFWVAVHRHVTRVAARHPGRVLHLDYDKLVHDPAPQLSAVFDFFGAEVGQARLERFCADIEVPDSVGRHKSRASSDFRAADLAYVDTLAEKKATPVNLEAEILATRLTRPGDANRRAYVGPPDQYDFMGATQLRLLTGLGLREEDHVIDIGCGSLRAGRYLIQYLLPDRYVGVEPNTWLWQEALARETGSDVAAIKRPRFHSEEDFSLGAIREDAAEFVVAQSIFSHTGQDLFETALASAKRVLRPTGQLLFTAVTEGCPGYQNTKRGGVVSGWIYPACVTYSQSEVTRLANKAGFTVQPLRWFHPRQMWFRAVLDPLLSLTPEMEVDLGSGRPLFDDRF